MPSGEYAACVTLVMNRAFIGAFSRMRCAQGFVGMWKYESA